VSISRDGKDFVVAFQPENYVIFRGDDPNALRKLCRQLKWQTITDTASENSGEAQSEAVLPVPTGEKE
jgi:hypothetical protein